MKRFLGLLLMSAVLISCNLPDPQEAARLQTENESLKTQLETISQERDAAVTERDDLRARLEQIRKALENLPSVNKAPDSSASVPSTPDSSVTPETPDSNTVPVAPDASTPSIPEKKPVMPDSSETPDTTLPETPASPEVMGVTPETPAAPDATKTPDSSKTPDSTISAVEQLRTYADNVLGAAQNFKAQTKQEAPTNCAAGYAAGAYRVQQSLELKECKVITDANGDYRVEARDAAGNSISIP